MSSSRQLAAIMFTDIVGYTALMGRDEQKAFELLEKNRQIQKPIIEKNNGRWIKELGDGVMASFTTVSDAINAAIKIQQTCNASKEFQLRIGIHLGEVVFENDDIFGDGVNISSRIQAIANPGSIYVSEPVHQNISNKKDIQTRFIQEVMLKNVTVPVRVYEVMNGNNESSGQPSLVSKTIAEKSIAVLPFANLSSDPEQEYFSDGITEDIIARLSKIHRLKVISRTSIMQYKKTVKTTSAIAIELNVCYLLEGSVRRSGNSIRIVIQLIDALKDTHLWVDTFDRELTDVFAIQKEIAENIAWALETRLTSEERVRIGSEPTKNIEAYSLFLLGRSCYYRMTPEDFDQAINYYNQTISLDPEFAMPYAALAQARYYLGAGYFRVRPHEIVPDSFSLVQKSLQLDSALAEAYAAKAELLDWYYFEWDQAEFNFDQAIHLNPSDAHAHLFLAYHNLARYRIEKALAESKLALELDPNSLLIRFNCILILIWSRNFHQALNDARVLARIEPAHFGPWACIGLAASELGLYEESVRAFREAERLAGINTYPKLLLSYGLARAGNHEEARSLLSTCHKLEESCFVWPMGFALAYAHLEETEKALHYLERSFTERVGMICLAGCDPALDILRKEPRFRELVRKIGPHEAIAEIDKFG